MIFLGLIRNIQRYFSKKNIGPAVSVFFEVSYRYYTVRYNTGIVFCTHRRGRATTDLGRTSEAPCELFSSSV